MENSRSFLRNTISNAFLNVAASRAIPERVSNAGQHEGSEQQSRSGQTTGNGISHDEQSQRTGNTARHEAKSCALAARMDMACDTQTPPDHPDADQTDEPAAKMLQERR